MGWTGVYGLDKHAFQGHKVRGGVTCSSLSGGRTSSSSQLSSGRPYNSAARPRKWFGQTATRDHATVEPGATLVRHPWAPRRNSHHFQGQLCGHSFISSGRMLSARPGPAACAPVTAQLMCWMCIMMASFTRYHPRAGSSKLTQSSCIHPSPSRKHGGVVKAPTPEDSTPDSPKKPHQLEDSPCLGTSDSGAEAAHAAEAAAAGHLLVIDQPWREQLHVHALMLAVLVLLLGSVLYNGIKQVGGLLRRCLGWGTQKDPRGSEPLQVASTTNSHL